MFTLTWNTPHQPGTVVTLHYSISLKLCRITHLVSLCRTIIALPVQPAWNPVKAILCSLRDKSCRISVSFIKCAPIIIHSTHIGSDQLPSFHCVKTMCWKFASCIITPSLIPQSFIPKTRRGWSHLPASSVSITDTDWSLRKSLTSIIWITTFFLCVYLHRFSLLILLFYFTLFVCVLH